MQVHAAVSGALDRLHYEKDPCVKYDSSKKVWVYLHRNRTRDEFGMFTFELNQTYASTHAHVLRVIVSYICISVCVYFVCVYFVCVCVCRVCMCMHIYIMGYSYSVLA